MSIEDYEPVQSRFSRFIEWSETQEQFFAVISELLSSPGEDICVMKTTILCDGVVVATGHAEEVRNMGNVNKTSHVENCETSAIGRALANFPMHNFCGTSSDKRPSREEMQKVERMTTRQTEGGSITEPSNRPSEKQVWNYKNELKKIGKLPPLNLDSMDKFQISKAIEALVNGQSPAPQEEPEEAF